MIEVSKDSISQIIKSLNSGQIVALPTETVFGLAAKLDSSAALEKLIYLKRRDLKSGKIFTLVPESKDAVFSYALPTKLARHYVAKYFPGEITLILPKNPDFRHPYFNHFDTIGLRLPNFPIFSSILPSTGPLFLTSANPRGDAPATNSEIIKSTLPKVDLVVTEKLPEDRLPSTIIDLTGPEPIIVRQGKLKPKP